MPLLWYATASNLYCHGAKTTSAGTMEFKLQSVMWYVNPKSEG
ncbi:MAG: CxxxxCH/CxxCH domain-containing protein [Candidatus Hydrogenedentes bacterium]|nr:CxxxxCH/CxxCH domain-containing protein [Candidatus Hydrogenedentota bacterium]